MRKKQSKKSNPVLRWLKEQKVWMLSLLSFGCVLGIAIFSDWQSVWEECIPSFDLDRCSFLGKTTWDWMGLLVVPLVLAIAAFSAEQYVKNQEEKKEKLEKEKQERQIKHEKEMADSQRQYEILHHFMDRIEEPVYTYGGQVQDLPREIAKILRARTEAVLTELDSTHKRWVFTSLNASGFFKECWITDEFRKINFAPIDLSNADLRGIKISRVNLSGANLSGANFSPEIDYGVTDLSEANLSGADLSEANLSCVDLTNAVLCEANLRGADLTNAVLNDTNLSGADLSDALFLATNLRAFFLTKDQLSGENSPFLCNTSLPGNITGIDPNRDCDRLPQILSNRYAISLEEAKGTIEEVRKKTWN